MDASLPLICRLHVQKIQDPHPVTVCGAWEYLFLAAKIQGVACVGPCKPRDGVPSSGLDFASRNKLFSISHAINIARLMSKSLISEAERYVRDGTNINTR
jgi:hypothetical protein